MSNTTFRKKGFALLGGRGWTRRLATAVGKDIATVKRWAANDLEVPIYITAVFELLEAVGDDVPKRWERA